MGFLDSIEGVAKQELEQGQQSEHGKVAGGFVQALQEHPGGLGGLLDSFRQNGMGQHVDGWVSGQNQTATPEQVQQGLGETGLIEKTAEKAGVSPEVAKIALAAILPMVVQHFAPGGQPAPQGAIGGLAGQFMSKFL